ncbi:MAG: amino acid adenylation domain-containing protein, partial [Bacteroidota bacterium]
MLHKKNIQDIYELSPLQKGMYFHALVEAEADPYFSQTTYRVTGPLDTALLERSLQLLVQRHDVLRTVFNHKKADEIIQIVLRERSAAFQLLDLRGLGAEAQEQFIANFQEEDRRRGFQLHQDNLLRVTLIQTAERGFTFVWSAHHIIIDGWCQSLLIGEFQEIYLSLLRGECPDLPPAGQYRAYIEWLGRQDAAAAQTFWKHYLADYEGQHRLFAESPAPQRAYENCEISLDLPEALCDRIRTIGKERGLTLSVLLKSLWGVLLHKYQGTERVLIGQVGASRPAEIPHIDRAIGLFINTTPVILRIDPEASFLALAHRVQAEQLETEAHHFLPLSDIQQQSELRQHLIDHTFIFENFPPIAGAGPEAGTPQVDYAGSYAQTNYAFNLVILPNRSITVKFNYNGAVLPQQKVAGLVDHFSHLLEQVGAEPEQKIGSLRLLRQAEVRELLERNGTMVTYPAVGHAYASFLQVTIRHADRLALVDGETSWTYRELAQQASRVGHLLRQNERFAPGKTVAVFLDRSPASVAVLLGIWQAGGIYLPIATDQARERVAFMLADAEAVLTISEAKYLPQLRDWQIEAIDHRDCADYPDTFQEPRGLELSDTAYLIYTSGTTGRPKGVPIRHESILNQILFHNEYLEMAVGERFLHLASLAFDASLVEILMPLFSGGTLVVAGQALKENTDRLLTFLKEQRVNAAIFPPAYLRLLDRVEQTELRKVISTGEAILTEDALRFADRLAIYNGYGPTECCIGATFHRVDPSKRVAYQKAGGIPIGKPFANTSVYIVGPQLELLPEGRIGEICVAGTGLSQGYWKRSDLTADKFAPNPYARFAYERQWYRTGDLGRWNAAGELEFCGRIDDQLQLSGIRVEPQEIARGIRALTAAKRVVVDQVQRDGSAVLCAFVEGAVEVDERILRQSLREHLPAYMIPQRLLYWEAFPLTANGKVDKAQLLQGLEQSAERPTEGRMPRSPEGQLLCQTIAQCLQCPVDLDTDFFYVGGDSIKAIQIVSRLYRQGYALEVKSIFKYPIIEQLLTQLKPLRALAEQGVVKGAYPLSPIQQEFFQLPLQHPEHFNHAELFTSQIPLREEEVRRVLQKLLEHHDGLRSTFARDAQGQWRARIEDAALRPRLLSFDLRQEADVPARRRELSEQLQSAFQLDQGPLLQAAIFRDRQGDQLLIVVHHLVFDGISWRIFMEDLQLLFEQVRQGQPLELPPKTDSYQSWTKALQAYAGSESLATDRDYWSQRVAGKVIPLEPDTAEGVTATTINLSVGDTQQLRMRTVKAYGTELNTLLVALLGRAVQRTWGLEQVALMLEGHGRVELFPDLQISRTIGWFTSLYPCTLPSGASGEWTEWIKAVQTQLKAIPNQGIGYGILQGLAREPLEGPAASRPNLLFNYLGAFEETTEEGAILRALDADLGPSSHPDEKPTFGLSVNAWIEDNVLSLRFQYDRSAHRRERIEQLARAYETALRNLLQSTPGHSTRDEQLERQLQAEYPNGVADFYPLSPMQEALYFQALSQPDSTAYLYQVAYPIEGPLEVDQVRDSLEKLVARHAILRTVFRDKLGDRNWQIVLRSAEIDLRYEDYSVVSTAEQERKIEAYLEADRGHLFDLAKGPLLRVSILRTSPRHFHFVWTSHHILMDGWCFGVLVEEFLEIYRAAQEGTPPQLPTVRPYRDFIDWLSTQDQTGAEAYWQEYLRGFERTTGLGHRSKAAQRDEAFSLARTSVTLTPARTQAIYDRCRQWHVTPSLFLQTAWALLLARYNYTQDVVFGKTVAGRPPELEGIEQMTGLFVNTIPVR